MMSSNEADISGFESEEGAYPFYARVREHSPVFWSERLRRWVLTRHEDVFAAYRDVARFSSRTFLNRGAGAELHDPAQDRVVDIFGKQILLLDRPDHTRLRRLVSRAFTPRSVEQMRDYTDRRTRSMLDGLRGEEFDFVRHFAGPLPLSVVTEIFGISIDDRDQYRAWSDSLTITTSSNQPPELLAVAFRHVAQMCTYLEELVEDRRRRPTDGLLSRMIQAEDGDDRFTTDEIVAMAMIITAAGHETTTSLLVNSLRLLLDDPAGAERLAHDNTFRRTAIEEVLRWEPPLQFSTRVTTEDIELHGTSLPAGSAVALAAASANRDPRQFPQAEKFDPRRSPNHHLTFGSGPHACLGASLARLEADVVISILSRDYPRLRANGDIVRKPSPLFRGFEKVTAEWR